MVVALGSLLDGYVKELNGKRLYPEMITSVSPQQFSSFPEVGV